MNEKETPTETRIAQIINAAARWALLKAYAQGVQDGIEQGAQALAKATEAVAQVEEENARAGRR